MTQRLNGPQTTGRTYRELSEPRHATRAEHDVPVPVRDGTRLLADVFRPDASGRFPALLAFSAYPRQMQQSGLPMGFVEAGATDFWVSRGYVHVIANARGTGGSEGTYTLLDGTERDDLHDTIEWIAAQDWCDGRVGMIGVSYFAVVQHLAAVSRPPSLKAIFPLAGATGMRQATYHGGMLSDLFLGSWLAGIAMLSPKRRADAFRSRPAQALSRIMHSERVHRRFEDFNGEAAIGSLGKVMRLPYDPHPWEDLYEAAATGDPGGAFWSARDVQPLLDRVEVPAYVGGGWDNVPLHLPGAFSAWEALPAHPGKRLMLVGPGGLTWPWESMHEEALAWYDHWLKDRDTGILDGPPIRYWMRGAEEWRTLDAWPPPEPGAPLELHLRADAALGGAGGAGGRDYAYLPPMLSRPPNAKPLGPASLTWDGEPAAAPYDVLGAPVLELDAEASAAQVDWIAKLALVDGAGQARDLTMGWLRTSADGGPWRIEMVPTAVRVQPGERLRLTVAGDDRHDGIAMTGFTHLPLAQPSRQHVRAGSRLVVPRV